MASRPAADHSDQRLAQQLDQTRRLPFRFGNPDSNENDVNWNMRAPARPSNVHRNEAINKYNNLDVVETDRVFGCKTEYAGKLVHRQFLSRPIQPNASQPGQVGGMNNTGNQQESNGLPPQIQMNIRPRNVPQLQPNAPPPQGQGASRPQQ
jgi:hypothetical protein